MSWLAVGAGAAIGAWMRWGLSVWLNAAGSHVMSGTLAANLIGAYLIGLALAFFGAQSQLPEAWRLFVTTGLLGGLTTFSAFSAEALMLLQRGEYAWALAHAGLHLVGSILLCAAGFATYRSLTG
jgi:fluoride exporter